MKAGVFTFIFLIAVALIGGCRTSSPETKNDCADFVVNPQQSNIKFYWKDEKGNALQSIENLKIHLEQKGKRLRFAMNGGMYQEGNKPLGLYIENQKNLAPLNTAAGIGNFYLQPNGVFYLTADGQAFIKRTQDFGSSKEQAEFATQSGPMLVIDGAINPQFKKDSDNLNIRNGVCVLENGAVFFSISRRETNFYDFAEHFRQAGCRDALYLDGFVSRMYLPEKNIDQTDGDFGVMIGVTD